MTKYNDISDDVFISLSTTRDTLWAIARNGDSFFSGKYTTDPFPNTPKSMRKKARKTNVK
jgi:hypothetical protein